MQKKTDKSPAEIFTEATGGHWHECIAFESSILYKCSCGTVLQSFCFKEHCKTLNPTYQNAADIFRRMKEFLGEERYKEFINSFTSYTDFRGWKTYMPTTDFINRFILNTTALLLEAIEFLRSGK